MSVTSATIQVEVVSVEKALFSGVAEMVIASAIMAVVTYVTLQFLQLRADDQGLLATLPMFVVITAVSFIVYVIVSKKLKLDEAEPVVARVWAIVFGRRR